MPNLLTPFAIGVHSWSARLRPAFSVPPASLRRSHSRAALAYTTPQDRSNDTLRA
jgi:hypothetical protein